MKRRDGFSPTERQPYPVDGRGIPLEPSLVSDDFFDYDIECLEPRNNHHKAFYARSFGRMAISQTFRDLDIMQTTMIKRQHDLLHRRYAGIEVPALDVMLEQILLQKFIGGALKIARREEGQRKYVLEEIDDELLQALHREYNEHNPRKVLWL